MLPGFVPAARRPSPRRSPDPANQTPGALRIALRRICCTLDHARQPLSLPHRLGRGLAVVRSSRPCTGSAAALNRVAVRSVAGAVVERRRLLARRRPGARPRRRAVRAQDLRVAARDRADVRAAADRHLQQLHAVCLRLRADRRRRPRRERPRTGEAAGSAPSSSRCGARGTACEPSKRGPRHRPPAAA